MLFSKPTPHISHRSAIGQLSRNPPRLTTRTHQLTHRVINTILRTTHNHRTTTMTDNINRHLPTHPGATPDNNDLLGIEVHGERDLSTDQV